MGSSRSGQRGEGKVGCMLTLLVFLLVVAVGVKLVPVLYSNSNLADAAGDLAGQAALYPVPVLESRARAKAMELGIPEAAADGAIVISVSGGRSGTCTVTFDYARTVDFYGLYSLNIATRKTIILPYMDAR
jgi:hypothetical protein